MTSKNDILMARAQRTTPGGVNSPVRAFRSVGGTPRFITHAEGPYYLGRRRQALHRLCRLVGPGHRRPRPPGGGQGRPGSGRERPFLRRADRGRNRNRRGNLPPGAVDRAGAPGVVRHRSDHERPAPGARRHRPRHDRQIRRLLPRPRRFAAGQGRQRPAYLRQPDLGRRAGRFRPAHPGARL